MIEPDDYGLDAVRTMAHVADPVRSQDHSGFWKRWYSGLLELSPTLTRRTIVDESDPSATHEFESSGGVRIGCRLITPDNKVEVRRAMVTLHGYSGVAPLEESVRRWQGIANNGVAVLALRVRGFPGSRIGIGDQTQPDALGAGWIARGLDSDSDADWILPHAILDACNAVRVMRNVLLGRNDADVRVASDIDHAGVWMHGTSMGGGIATIASGLLSGRIPNENIVDRVAIALPSLGAWTWRMHQRPSGACEDIVRVVRHHQDRAIELMDRVRLCDAAIFASHVRVPTLAMLATRDDVVPAPSAAAIYNAIDSGPGQKWRYTVPFGHFDGGITNARRHALFGRMLHDFFDPSHSAIDALTDWEPRMHDGVCAPGGSHPEPINDPRSDADEETR